MSGNSSRLLTILYNKQFQSLRIEVEDDYDSFKKKCIEKFKIKENPNDNDAAQYVLMENKVKKITKEMLEKIKNESTEQRTFYFKKNDDYLMQSLEKMQGNNTDNNIMIKTMEEINKEDSEFFQGEIKKYTEEIADFLPGLLNDMLKKIGESTTSLPIHKNIDCSDCKKIIIGNRYLSEDGKCNLCESCFDKSDPSIIFDIIRTPNLSLENVNTNEMIDDILYNHFCNTHSNYKERYTKDVIIKSIRDSNGEYSIAIKDLKNSNRKSNNK